MTPITNKFLIKYLRDYIESFIGYISCARYEFEIHEDIAVPIYLQLITIRIFIFSEVEVQAKEDT